MALKMSERKINAALRILHDIMELVLNAYWRVSSMEESSSIEYLESPWKSMTTIKDKFLHFLSNRDHLMELVKDVLWCISEECRRNRQAN